MTLRCHSATTVAETAQQAGGQVFKSEGRQPVMKLQLII